MSYNATSSWYNNHASKKSNYVPRPVVAAPQKSQIPGLGYDSNLSTTAWSSSANKSTRQQQQQPFEDDPPPARRQWMQENDLDLYQDNLDFNGRGYKENFVEDGGPSNNYDDEEYENYRNVNNSVNVNENLRRDEQYALYNKNINNSEENYIEQYSKDSHMQQPEFYNSERPTWLNDEGENSYSCADQTGGKPTTEQKTSKYIDNFQQNQTPTFDKTASSQQLHKKFLSNPLLASKSPFAMEYEHKDGLMSENNRAFGIRLSFFILNSDRILYSLTSIKKLDSDFKSNMAINNSDYYKNRLKSQKEQRSDMSTLLSFGYAKEKTNPSIAQDKNSMQGIMKGTFPSDNRKMGSRENSFSVRFSESTKGENADFGAGDNRKPLWCEQDDDNLGVTVNSHTNNTNLNNNNYGNERYYNNSYLNSRQKKSLFNESTDTITGETKPDFFRLGSSSSNSNLSLESAKKNSSQTSIKSGNDSELATTLNDVHQTNHTSNLPNSNSSNDSDPNPPKNSIIADNASSNGDSDIKEKFIDIKATQMSKCRFPKLKPVDLGKPDFFNMARSYNSSNIGCRDGLNEGTLNRQRSNLSSPTVPSANFRRRKVDINSSILPTPMKPQARR
ncbi:hypothetical protein HELRODRAFT_193050 [Helobdella robusta]|uniref:Uncharacterized protein n=1 Tax=Helobdella robusta TaxID=6412 RepID=T1FUK5_HELRO|nr:hypothetical protein HELRODRAFT_193050 [Helobdella robusta]ESN98331.1 hypothetical protein HELRODRAFT_193050 [Helobdella robusta]